MMISNRIRLFDLRESCVSTYRVSTIYIPCYDYEPLLIVETWNILDCLLTMQMFSIYSFVIRFMTRYDASIFLYQSIHDESVRKWNRNIDLSNVVSATKVLCSLFTTVYTKKKKWNIILQINDIWYFSWQRNSFAYGKKCALAVAQFSNIIAVIVYYFVWLSILC